MRIRHRCRVFWAPSQGTPRRVGQEGGSRFLFGPFSQWLKSPFPPQPVEPSFDTALTSVVVLGPGGIEGQPFPRIVQHQNRHAFLVRRSKVSKYVTLR